MIALVEQTREQKLAMYCKLTKRELAEMLINANDALKARHVSCEPVTTHADAQRKLAKALADASRVVLGDPRKPVTIGDGGPTMWPNT